MEEKERLKKIKYEKKKEEKKKEKVSCKYMMIKVKVILKYECKCCIIFIIDPLRSTLLVFKKINMRKRREKMKEQSQF